MYTKVNNKLANKINLLPRYFDGNDVTNSVLLKELPELASTNRVEITSRRYDLLAELVYGDASYDWVLQLYNGILESDLELGGYLKYPALDDVKNLILSLDEYNN